MPHISHDLYLQRLAELWQLSARQRRILVALDEKAVPALQDIQQTLQNLFPHNPQLAELWPTTANKAFDNRSPMQIIEEHGLAGVEEIRRFLCLHH